MYFFLLAIVIYFAPIALVFLLQTAGVPGMQNKAAIWRQQTPLILAICWTLGISLLFERGQINNLALHFLGGGVTSALIFIFILSCFKQKLPPMAQALLLYFFVSGLGVANEILLEFPMQHFLGLNFAPDVEDTWRDLTANTAGAYTGWLLTYFLNPQNRQRL